MLSGLEWAIIGVVAVIIILWGPSRIPELVKALGKANVESNEAPKEFKSDVGGEGAQ